MMAPKKRLKRRHTLAERWFHWVNVPLLTIMVWSGLLIYWANDVYRIGFGNWTLVKFFPQWFYDRFFLSQRLSEGLAWHLTFAWFFGINAVLYGLYLLFSGQWRHFVPKLNAPLEALKVVKHDLTHLKPDLENPNGAKFNAAQQLSYLGIIGVGGLSLLTGLAIWKPVQLSWLTALLGGYEIARWLHFWGMMAFCGFVVVHVLQVIRAGWRTLRAMLTGYDLEPIPDEKEPMFGGNQAGVRPELQLSAVAPQVAPVVERDDSPATGGTGSV